MSHLSYPTPSRHGGLITGVLALIGLLVVIIVAIVLFVGRENVANIDVYQYIERVVGQQPVEGRVIAVRDGSDRDLPTYASVRLETTGTYEQGDVFQVVKEDGSTLLCQIRVESVAEDGSYVCVVLPDTWPAGQSTHLPQGSLVFAPNREN